MADNPNWFRGAIGDLFDGKPSERKTGFFEDMLDGGGYANRGETGGILGFMQRMFGSETPGAPKGRPKMNVTMSVTDVPGRPKGRPNMTATPYYDGMGMGDQAGGQSTYYDGMGMDYGMGRLQAPQMQRPVSDSGMNPANAYVPQQMPQQPQTPSMVAPMGNQIPTGGNMPKPAIPGVDALSEDTIRYLRSIGVM